MGGGGGSQGDDLTLNSVLRTWLSLKHPPFSWSLQAARVYGQVQGVFLVDLNVSFANQEPIYIIYILYIFAKILNPPEIYKYI